MSRLFAIVVPILPGKEGDWKKWITELSTTRYNDFVNSRKKLNVHERTFLQHTPMGDMIIVTLEGDDPQGAFAKFASANDEFTKWFVEGVKNAHGIDLAQPPPGPMPELIMDSERKG
jgi:hypothetical protein